MDVPGETAERGAQLSRPRLTALALAAFALLSYLYLPLPAPAAPPPRAGDCVELHLWSNGYHSDIGAPADMFPADHPLRMLYPQAREFLIGWGEERFYYSDGSNLWLGLDAIVPPSPTVLHVTYNAPTAAAYLGPNDDLAIPISREGAARFVAYIDAALVLNADGAVIVTAPGKVIGRSAFLRTQRLVSLIQRLQSLDGAGAAGGWGQRQRPGGLAGGAADSGGASGCALGMRAESAHIRQMSAQPKPIPAGPPSQADIAYLGLLQDILDHGVDRGDRTGTGTRGGFRAAIALRSRGGLSATDDEETAPEKHHPRIALVPARRFQCALAARAGRHHLERMGQ